VQGTDLTAMILIISIQGHRIIEASEIPLAVGISSSGIVLYGEDAEQAPVLWIRTHESQIYIQPESGAYRITHNEVLIEGSAWLKAGDQIGIGEASIAIGENDGMLTFAAEAGQERVPPPLPPIAELPENSSPGAASGEQIPVATAPQLRDRRGSVRKYIIGLFAILLLGAGFVIVAAPVRVTITPKPDSLSFNGIFPSISIGGRYLALPGEYSVAAKLSGYHNLDKQVAISFGSKPALTYQMKKLPGLLTVTSAPVSGARVKIGDRSAGTTPLTDYKIEPGRQTVTVSADRYLPATRSVDIRGMGESQKIELRMQPGWGTLIVNSFPEQAVVRLAGKEVGKTPLVFEPMQGDYPVTVSKEGWKPAKSSFTIKAGQTLSLRSFRLERIDGQLSLKTSPTGAIIAIDGLFRGRTPVSLPLVSKKKYRVKLTKPGYAPYARTVEIAGGATTEVNAKLKPEYGILFIRTRPSGAKLMVDGKYAGAASQRLQLRTTVHRIEISKPGYAPFATKVTPRKGASKRLNVELKKHIEVAREAARQGIDTKAGQKMRLFPIGKPMRFGVGASRREAGRRSNETQYTVELTRSFMIGEKEVTNQQFRMFRPGHNSGNALGADLNGPQHPVASVSWDDAARYLNWLSEKEKLPPAYHETGGKMVAVDPMNEGYRLPTEAEWAFVARYDGGRQSLANPLKYSWGGAMPPTANSGNFADDSASRRLPAVIRGYLDGHAAAAPVGSFEPNKSGLFDLGGNVAEWCHDYYDIFVGGAGPALRDPMGPKTGEFHVVRGSSWRHGTVTELRLSYRDYARPPRNDLGFRIARYVKISK
jgi:formylglycine-generating enzyme required for sulfatase activity